MFEGSISKKKSDALKRHKENEKEEEECISEVLIFPHVSCMGKLCDCHCNSDTCTQTGFFFLTPYSKQAKNKLHLVCVFSWKYWIYVFEKDRYFSL
jgi:hypothetical protein